MNRPLLRFGRRTVLLVSAILCLTLTTAAQEKSFTIETSTMQPSVALGRPMLTWWDVKIPGTGLLVGKFRFVVKSEGYVFTSFETEELTLNGPEQRIRVLLPAVDCSQFVDQLQVDISFQGKKFSGPMGQQVLRVPFATKTVFIGLVGESRTVRKRTPHRDAVLECLRFEATIPQPKKARGDDNDSDYVKTIFASIDPSDFPSEPLAYCGYDLVVLMNDEFRNLRKPQLEGLLAWVKSGGSLYVEPNGVLEGYHVDFLRSLISDDPQEVVIHVDEAGKLFPETIPADLEGMAFQCGIGNAVIRQSDPGEEIDKSEEGWQLMAGALWKGRAQPWNRSVEGSVDPYGFLMAHYNRTSLGAGELLDRLMPDGVRMVPLSLLAAILFVFVCLIGPGDYFGLGRLRLRKLTWITFPAATLAVTALMVWLSNSYMTSAETRRAVVLRDLGPKGEIVRSNRFELLFIGSTHQVATTVEKGLFATLATMSGLENTAGAGFGFVINKGPGASVQLPNGQMILTNSPDGKFRPVTTQVEGRIPTQFTVKQDLAKWTPQVNRIMSIPGTAVSPEIDWTEFDLSAGEAQTIRSTTVPSNLLVRVKERFGPNAIVACFHGRDGVAYDRSPGWRSSRTGNLARNYTWNQTQFQTPGANILFEADLFRWIYRASITASEQGYFALSKQTTPKGSANCEDLSLLDTSDPNAWLLVIVVPENDDFVVYRKVMRFR